MFVCLFVTYYELNVKGGVVFKQNIKTYLY